MVLCWAVVLAVLGRYAWQAGRPRTAKQPRRERVWRPAPSSALKDGSTHPLFDDYGFVWDDVAYVRPRADYSFERTGASINGRKELPFRINLVEHGIVRHQPVGPQPGKPTVLLLGDSHFYATVSMKHHVYCLLEESLRVQPGLERTTVVNAACPFYSLYQYVLRARTLWGYIRPDAVVVLVFVGNDLLELEDLSRPHIDDELAERDISHNIPPETTEARRKLFERTALAPYRSLFWQGINQETYFLQNEQRYEVVLRKATRTVELMQAQCRQGGAKLVFALLPSYEDTYDYQLPFGLDPSIAGLIDRRANRCLRGDLKRIIEAKGLPVVDFHDCLNGAEQADLYDADFHIWTAGHALLSEALLPVVRSQLRIRDRQ